MEPRWLISSFEKQGFKSVQSATILEYQDIRRLVYSEKATVLTSFYQLVSTD